MTERSWVSYAKAVEIVTEFLKEGQPGYNLHCEKNQKSDFYKDTESPYMASKRICSDILSAGGYSKFEKSFSELSEHYNSTRRSHGSSADQRSLNAIHKLLEFTCENYPEVQTAPLTKIVDSLAGEKGLQTPLSQILAPKDQKQSKPNNHLPAGRGGLNLGKLLSDGSLPSQTSEPELADSRGRIEYIAELMAEPKHGKPKSFSDREEQRGAVRDSLGNFLN